MIKGVENLFLDCQSSSLYDLRLTQSNLVNGMSLWDGFRTNITTCNFLLFYQCSDTLDSASPFILMIVPDQVRTKRISKGGWTILKLLSHVGTIKFRSQSD